MRREVELFRAHPDRIVGLGHNGVRGNPCIFPGSSRSPMALTGDVGGNIIGDRAHPESLLLAAERRRRVKLRDVDTVEALAAMHAQKRSCKKSVRWTLQRVERPYPCHSRSTPRALAS